MSKSKFTLLSVIIFLISACSDYKTYHQFYSISQGSWSKTDSLVYEIQNIPEHAALQVEVRFTSEYPYSDLYLAIRENLSDSTYYKVDTLKLSLTHSDGRSKGSTLGKLYQTSKSYKTINTPQKAKSNQIYIYHLMNDSTLVGIEDVGIRVTHADDAHDPHPNEEKQTEE
ncbi:gliding motility lipoprotein GldH [Bacteroides propionicifaciens]|uniref:gliding motility lipoprotein GldH n=1 Tax=Bacteroides propionicifaciens TaxID=392838 RepID=UPI00047772E3|nr:gliding motility lipoprotein GldH [Bacteroides propionicifaciens]